jgi:hypothetical protein
MLLAIGIPVVGTRPLELNVSKNISEEAISKFYSFILCLHKVVWWRNFPPATGHSFLQAEQLQSSLDIRNCKIKTQVHNDKLHNALLFIINWSCCSTITNLKWYALSDQ